LPEEQVTTILKPDRKRGLYRPSCEETSHWHGLAFQADDNGRLSTTIVRLICVEHDLRLWHGFYDQSTINVHAEWLETSTAWRHNKTSWLQSQSIGVYDKGFTSDDLKLYAEELKA